MVLPEISTAPSLLGLGSIQSRFPEEPMGVDDRGVWFARSVVTSSLNLEN
jgi:hypothetical protein